MLALTQFEDDFGHGIARQCWIPALRGVIAILFGLVAIIMPGPTLLALVLLCGAFMAVDGVLAVIASLSAVARHRHGAALVAEGMLGLVIAAILLVMPIAGIATAVFLAAAWAILTGAALLWAAIALPLLAGRAMMLAAAILALVWGVLVAMWPMTGAVVLAWWLGAYAIISGVFLLALAGSLRRFARDWSTPGSTPGSTQGSIP